MTVVMFLHEIFIKTCVISYVQSPRAHWLNHLTFGTFYNQLAAKL